MDTSCPRGQILTLDRPTDHRFESAESLRRSEQRYRSLALATASIVWTTDPEGRLTEPSPSWEEFTGQTYAQYSGAGWTAAVHPQDLERVLRTWDEALSNRSLYAIEYRIRRRDGQWRHMLVRGVPVVEDGGEVREWVGACTDITERIAAEEELRKAQRQIARQLEVTSGIADTLADSEQRLRLVVDAGKMATWEWTVGSDAIEFSPAMEELHGIPISTFGGDLPAFLANVHPEDRDMVSQCLLATLERRIEHQIEYRVVLPDGGARWIEGRGKLFTDMTGKPQRVIGVCMDITPRKWAEQAQRRTKDELERQVDERTAELQSVNRQLVASNRELEDFASIASHDLQEPLRKIQAFGGRLENRAGAALDEESRDYLKRMLRAAGRMQRLISDLLQFSRVTTKAQPFAPVDLNAIVGDVLSDMETTIEQSGGRVEAGPLPTLDADAVQMQQLLQNLIGNGLKFCKPEVPPVVKVYQAPAAPDSKIRICVEDNGIGFDEKYLDRIFNVFQRLHGRSEYEGTGIGLAVCRKVAERHGGSITATSKAGVGSTFIVTLPLRHALTESVHVV